ncbi:hypothetical protein [Paracoccus sp. SSJ]|uniref:hypothetical protein n=1 Tax=Paracoccus sp. SSJ TaxID=3050636 RepID=UPI00254EDF2D|nr:hypothetical protein [Paracoccus sp. SSJ]MDK8874214.1 hypothetical protein [Paracoccus sp. SSJ]
MNTQSQTVAGRPRPGSQSWGRFAGIVAIYALLGPLVGAIGVTGLFTVYAVGVEIAIGNFDDIARRFVGGMLVGTIVSAILAYAYGIVSAADVGLVVAFRDRRKGGISWRMSLVAALAFWLLMSLAATAVVPPQGLVQWIGALLAAHVLAPAVGTWIARRIFR